MDLTLKEVLKELEPALMSLTIFYVFAFYPLAIYFWSQAEHHIIYYFFMAGIGLVSGWLLHSVLKDYLAQRRAMLTEIMALFNMINIVICSVFIAFPLKFYYLSSKWFLNLFKDASELVYVGPDVMRAVVVFILISNIFFFIYVIKYKPQEQEQDVQPQNQNNQIPPKYRDYNNI
ncbi:hypothetical protein H8D83_02590 [Candidatus Woesearchaeota archaeon]|nr:hypothetical protein [Candidatus Woesearchaeota archaeon]MBL7051168.1 hypothetical protein [Candidatus Woesearchaeota archaeon]